MNKRPAFIIFLLWTMVDQSNPNEFLYYKFRFIFFRKIVDYVDFATNAQQIAEYLKQFRCEPSVFLIFNGKSTVLETMHSRLSLRNFIICWSLLWFHLKRDVDVVCIDNCVDDDGDELILWNGWPTKSFKPYFQLVLLSKVLTIASLRYVVSRIWTCAEPEFRLCWRKSCISYN